MSRSGRIGLSEYTAQRLADLRARRAEADLSDGTYTSSSFSETTERIELSESTTTLSSSSNNGSASFTSGASNSSESGSSSLLTSPERSLVGGVNRLAGLRSFDAGDVYTKPSENVQPLVSKLKLSNSSSFELRGNNNNNHNGISSSDSPAKVAPRTAPKPPSSGPPLGPPPAPPSVPPLATDEDMDQLDEPESSFETTSSERTGQWNKTTRSKTTSTSGAAAPREYSLSRVESRGVNDSTSTSGAAAPKEYSLPKVESRGGLNEGRKEDVRFGSGFTSSMSGGGGGTGLHPSSANRGSVPQLSERATSNGSVGGSTMSRSTSKLTENDDETVIGFANLQEQIHRKAVKRGFDFTLMVVGETGLGKSTLVTSMFFNNDLYKDRIVPPVQERISKTVQIEKRYLEMDERGVKLRLTVVDTPGFNDSLDSGQCWKPVEDYIHEQFAQYFTDECGLNRRNIKDNRVHCCLYFISPYGRGLRQVDVQFMRRIHNKVNLVPVIAKADTLTSAEVQRLKARVLAEIKSNDIHIYELPECDTDEDEEYAHRDLQLKGAIPFSVIGSNSTVEINGRKVKGRIYPWGIVEVENPAHSDFMLLRQFLISTHMHDLKDVTREVHYENFRAVRIDDQINHRLQTTTTTTTTAATSHGDRRLQDASLSTPVLESSDADRLLRQKEAEIQRMTQMLQMMQAQLAADK